MIYAAAIALLSLYALWVFFLSVMAIQSAKDRGTLTPWGLRLGFFVLIPGLLLNSAIQMLLASIMFWGWPRELLVSELNAGLGVVVLLLALLSGCASLPEGVSMGVSP